MVSKPDCEEQAGIPILVHNVTTTAAASNKVMTKLKAWFTKETIFLNALEALEEVVKLQSV